LERGDVLRHALEHGQDNVARFLRDVGLLDCRSEAGLCG